MHNQAHSWDLVPLSSAAIYNQHHPCSIAIMASRPLQCSVLLHNALDAALFHRAVPAAMRGGRITTIQLLCCRTAALAVTPIPCDYTSRTMAITSAVAASLDSKAVLAPDCSALQAGLEAAAPLQSAAVSRLTLLDC